MGIKRTVHTVHKDDSLSRSFMCLGFAAAALIILVQWRKPASLTVTQPSTPVTVNDSLPTPLAQSGLLAAFEGATEPIWFAEDRLVVDLSDRQVYLHKSGKLAANYEIAVGQLGWETPTGAFSVVNMRIDPVWQHPFTGEIVPAGPENPLGSRWIGFWIDGEHQIGLHGTNNEALIGQAVSHGCIRMREDDIQALYTEVTLGMPVIVRP